MKAFITGSHAYGKPHEGSDVDLVLRVDDSTRADLIRLLAADGSVENSDYEAGEVIQFKVGSLNLLLCVTDEQYSTWVIGTQQLKAIAPVTRDFAVETFKRLRGATPLLTGPKDPPLLTGKVEP